MNAFRATASKLAKQKKGLILHILIKKTLTLVLAKMCIYLKVLQSPYIYVSLLQLSIHYFNIFFSPFTFSLFSQLSLQHIISTTDNPASLTTHRPTTTTQHYQPHTDPPPQINPPSQPSTTNHRHCNPALPTTTITRTQHKINQNQTNLHKDTPTEIERTFFLNLWLWVGAWVLWIVACGMQIVDQ